MDQATIDRYQPGGDIYAQLVATYGQAGADTIAAAAKTGDNNGEVAAAIAQVKYGSPLDTSTADAFTNQILTDPLGAPLSSLNNVLGNTLLSFLKSPVVLLVIGVSVFLALGGWDYLKRKLKKAK